MRETAPLQDETTDWMSGYRDNRQEHSVTFEFLSYLSTPIISNKCSFHGWLLDSDSSVLVESLDPIFFVLFTNHVTKRDTSIAEQPFNGESIQIPGFFTHRLQV